MPTGWPCSSPSSAGGPAIGLGSHDVYVNLAGGLTVDEPGLDLPLALALASSLRDRPVAAGTVAIGEVGLLGELRAVGGLERRLREAARLGFGRAIVPAAGPRCRPHPTSPACEIVAVGGLRDAIEAALAGGPERSGRVAVRIGADAKVRRLRRDRGRRASAPREGRREGHVIRNIRLLGAALGGLVGLGLARDGPASSSSPTAAAGCSLAWVVAWIVVGFAILPYLTVVPAVWLIRQIEQLSTAEFVTAVVGLLLGLLMGLLLGLPLSAFPDPLGTWLPLGGLARSSGSGCSA